MFCPKCGNKLDDNVKFCNKCGKEIGKNVSKTKKIEKDGFSTIPEDAAATAVMPQAENPAQTAFQQAPNQTVAQQPVNQQQYTQGPASNKKNNVALFVVLGVLIAVIIAAVIVIFLVIKPFDQPETSTTATHTTEDTSSKNNNNNSSKNTKSVSCIAANGTTLSGTVRLNNEYVIPDSSSKSYTSSEIAALGLNDAEMCIAWNEPYARAGYHFKNSGLQSYFNSCSWYHDTGFSGTLSDIGGQNTNVIKNVAGGTQWKNLATY